MKVTGKVCINNKLYKNQVADVGLEAITTALIKAEPIRITHVFLVDQQMSSLPSSGRAYTVVDNGNYKGMFDFISPNSFVSLNAGLSVGYGTTNNVTDVRSLLMNISFPADAANINGILTPVAQSVFTTKYAMFVILNGDVNQTYVTNASKALTNVYVPTGNEILFSTLVLSTPLIKNVGSALDISWQITFDNS